MPISIFSKFVQRSQTPSTQSQDAEPVFEAKSPLSWVGNGDEGQLSVDLYQTNDSLVLRSTIAGVKESDLSISLSNDMLTIRGKREQDQSVPTENYFYQECYWGAFSRSVVLPVEVRAEGVQASMKNGVLTVVMPKAQARKSMEIKVNVE